MNILRAPVIFTALLFFFMLNPSCSSSSKYYPVTDIGPRENSHGFSISPPHGTGWYEKHKGASLLYLKNTEDKDHLVCMKATEINVDPAVYGEIGFEEFVRNLKNSHLPEDRYKNIDFRVNLYTTLSPHCAKYSYTYEDHGQKRNRSLAHIKVENNGLVCMHPDRENVGIDMYYIERARVKADLVSYREEGDRFLNSLKFFPRL